MDKYPYSIRVLSKVILLVFFYFSSACVGDDYVDNKDFKSTNNFTNCVVYYDDFLLQRAFGLSENQLEIYAQKFECDAKQMNSLLNTKNIKEIISYTPYNIKAKVIIDKNIYFIDSEGYVRNVEKFSKINVKEFMNLMHTYQVNTNK